MKIRDERAALVAVRLLSGSGLLKADDFVWKTAGDGTYADKTKWLMNQGGVSVDAPRAPNASDTVTLRDGSYSVFLNGDSAGSFYAASDYTLSVGGGFTVGDFTGSPFITGGGTLVVGTNTRLEVSSAHELVVGADAGSYGHLTVNGSLAWLGAALSEAEATVVVGRGGRGQMIVSDTGQAVFKTCTVGESAEDNTVAILGPQPQSLQGNLDAEELTVGQGGRGSVTVDGGGRLTAARLKIGVNSTADNRVTIGPTAKRL